MKKKWVAMFLLLFVLLYISCACKQAPIVPTAGGTPATEVTSTTEGSSTTEGASVTEGTLTPDRPPELKTYPLPTENIRFSDYVHYCCPASIGGYYFCSGKYLIYRQTSSATPVPLCVQPSCKHNDWACTAYMGGIMKQLAEYRGKLYALVEAEDGSQSVVAYELGSGERETLLSWPNGREENGQLIDKYVNLNTLAHGRLYYTVDQTNYSLETMEVLEEATIYTAYDLAAGTQETLPLFPSCIGKAGIVHRIVDRYYDEAVGEYITKEAQLRLYNPETWEYEVLVDYWEDGFVYSPDPAYKYGSLVSYVRGNTLYVFDAETGQSKELVTPQDPVVNYWLMDQKIFYITLKNGTDYYYYYADLTDCVPVQLKNEGNTEGMVFGIFTEGVDFFADNNSRILSKEDFYAENYD